MVLSVQSTGQMCNRIVSFVQSLGTAIDCGQNLVHFNADGVCSFAEMHPEVLPDIRVVCKSHPTLCRYVEYCVIILCKIFKSLPYWYYTGNAHRCEKWRRRGNKRIMPIVHWFWYFRNDNAIVRHREKICAFLRAKDEHCARPRNLLVGFREVGCILVGVHMRRGDYREWHRGKFYFDDHSYARFMESFRDSCPEWRVKFLLVSNEKINVDYYRLRGLKVLDASGTPQEDIVSLSMCDYVMGPPSTFSWWAAYYGDRPLLHIYGASEKICRERFAKVLALKSLFAS